MRGHIYEAVDPKGLIVFSHGIWSGPEDYLTLITWLVDHNWNVFTYSYTGYNNSDGKWAGGLPRSVLDLHAALAYIESDPELQGMKRVILGHSWGAYAAAAVFNFSHSADAVITMSGFSDPVEISVDVAASVVGPLGRSMGWAVRLFNRILFGRYGRLTAVNGINRTDCPVLILHGENDSFINYQTSSIPAHRSEITNSKAAFLTLTDPLQSDHNNYFCSPEATRKFNTYKEKSDALKQKYTDKQELKAARRQLREQADIAALNEANTDLYEQIEEFLKAAIYTA
ncbi:MAG: alpha/beta fold hydrolase [Eubacteriales bacterium]|nr:alpha/beta fold hydrolase [Eubacteriales bacterium]